MTRRRPCPAAPGPLEGYAASFDDLFGSLAQRRGFREYLAGLLAPRDRNKTLTALAGAEPVAGAQHPAVQRLQFFLSEASWEAEAVNAQRLALLAEQPALAAHSGGVLVLDDTGDRKDGHATAHVARQYLGSVGKGRQRHRGRHEPVGRWPVLLAGACGALHARGPAARRQARQALSHQARHCIGSRRARTSRRRGLSRRGRRLRLRRERLAGGSAAGARHPLV